MQVPFVTTVSFADRDGTAIHLQYGVSAGNEREARSELERRLINQELFNYSILEIRRATSSEAASLDLPAGTIRLLNQSSRHHPRRRMIQQSPAFTGCSAFAEHDKS